MKFVSVAFVAALLCVVAVSADPSTPEFEELAFNPFENLGQKIKEYLNKLKCARDVVGKEVADSDLKNEFKQFESTVDQLFTELKNCSSAESKTEFFKCNIAVIKRLGQEFSGFLYQLSTTNKELAKKIREQVATQCVKTPEFFELEEETFAELLLDDGEENTPAKQNKFRAFLKKLKCMTVALDDATKGTKHAIILDQHKKEMWDAKDNIKACQSNPSKWKSSLCTAKELKKASVSLFKFFLKLKSFFRDLKADEEVNNRTQELIKTRCSKLAQF